MQSNRQLHLKTNNSPSPGVLIIFLLSSLFFISLVAGSVPPFNPDVSCCDHLFYRSMAYNLFSESRPDLNRIPAGNYFANFYKMPYWSNFFNAENRLNRQPPYIYRIFSPLVARGIGGLFFNDNINYGFYTLTFISLTLSCFFLSLIIYTLNRDIMASVLASFTFSSFWFAVGFNFFHYMLVDAAGFLFMLMAIFSMLKRKKVLFYFICFLGLFNKESMLFVLPCYVLYDFFEGEKIDITCFLGIVFILGVYLVFRMIMPVSVNTYSIKTILGFNYFWKQWFTVPFLTFGALIFFILTRAWLSKTALALAPLFLIVYISIPLVSDKERLFVYAFPFIIISTFGLKISTFKGRLLLIAPLIIYFFLNFVQDYLEIRFRIVFFGGLIIFLILENFFLREYFKVKGG